MIDALLIYCIGVGIFSTITLAAIFVWAVRDWWRDRRADREFERELRVAEESLAADLEAFSWGSFEWPVERRA